MRRIILSHDSALSVCNRDAVTAEASVDMDVVTVEARMNGEEHAVKHLINISFSLIRIWNYSHHHDTEDNQNSAGETTIIGERREN